MRPLKRVALALAGRDFFQRRQVVLPFEIHGVSRAGWAVSPAGLSRASVVYSFGVGEDVSFDVALIARYGLQVHAFDPTPRSVSWVRQQSLPPGFVFHEYGIAAFDGTATFQAPSHAEFVSFSMVNPSGAGPTVEAPVYRLCTIMERLGHDHIDLLKMDVEGAEYDVLDDLLASGVDVRQLLVEFHHRFPQVGAARTKEAIRRLNDRGYRIFYVSPRGEEFSFVHVQKAG